MEPNTVERLLDSGGSRAVYDAVHAMLRSPANPEIVDITSYLMAARRTGHNHPGTANALLSRLYMDNELNDGASFGEPALFELPVSQGLVDAFREAQAIRLQTGGADRWIGARHLLFAILTSTNPVIVDERRQAARFLEGLLSPDFWEALNRHLDASREEEENPEAWLNIFADRRLKDWPGAGAQGPESAERTDLGDFDAQHEPIPPVGNDNPWELPSGATVGEDAAALALARLAASTEFTPPLAVGVFGPWGSGKSFFLRRVCTEIERLQNLDDEGFHDNIVQIKFNAWHYVDTDLWASLAGHIFEELDSHTRRAEGQHLGSGANLLGQLSTARALTLEAARDLALKRKSASDAQQAVTASRIAVQARQRAFADALTPNVLAGLAAGAGIAKEKVADEKLGKKLQAMVEDAYGESLATLAGRWTEASAAAEGLGRDSAVLRAIVRQVSPWSLGSIGVVTVAMFATPIVLAWLAGYLPDLRVPIAQMIAQLNPVASAALAFMVSTGAFVSVATRRAVMARDLVVNAVRTFREHYETAGQAAVAGPATALGQAETNLTKAEDAAVQAAKSLAEALQDQAHATQAFHHETAAGRLRAFVRDRAAPDGLYRSRQGLVGAIRRDFGDLSALVSAVKDDAENKARVRAEALHKAQVEDLIKRFGDQLTEAERAQVKASLKPPDQPGFKRIVLYIDDLDRCPPPKVVEVLEAVHLLLAFSLFVVVVAVDVRWLEGSLESRYPMLGKKKGVRAQAGNAIAIDYLEKIFQVPIWTLEIGGEAASDFVARRLGSVEQAAPATSDGPRIPHTPGPLLHLRTNPDIGRGGDTLRTDIDGADEFGQPPIETLRLHADEAAWLKALAPVAAASPRRLLRLVNTYRVARASLNRDQAARVVAGGYRGLGAVLALSAAAPLQFPALLKPLRAQVPLRQILDDWRAVAGEDADLAGRLDQLGELLWEADLNLADDLWPYFDLAARFSFSG